MHPEAHHPKTAAFCTPSPREVSLQAGPGPACVLLGATEEVFCEGKSPLGYRPRCPD